MKTLLPFVNIFYLSTFVNMITTETFLQHIHPRVFWDCPIDQLDLNASKSFMITRVLMRGTDEEIRFIETNFTLSEIVQAVTASPEADPKCRNYYITLQKILPNDAQ